MATTNFEHDTNNLLGLLPDATATDRKAALRRLMPEAMTVLCLSSTDPDAQWATYRGILSTIEPWDVVREGTRFYAMWNDFSIHTNPTHDGAVAALTLFIDALYPVDFAQLSAGRLFFRSSEGLWVATYDGAVVGRGLDSYSACIDLLGYRNDLQAQGLTGPLFDQELEVVHG